MLHTDLAIYKAGYDLFGLITELERNVPRTVRPTLGRKIIEECVEILVLVFRANAAGDKVPHLDQLREHVQVVELLLRLCRDKRFIDTKHYAAAVKLTDSIGRQATGWRKHSASPAASSPRP